MNALDLAMNSAAFWLQGLIAFQSLFFAVFLLSVRGPKRQANALLAAFLCTLAWQMLNNLLPPGSPFPNLNPALGLLFGPLQFLYTRALVHRKSQLKLRDLGHGVPFLIALVLLFAVRLDIATFALAIYLSLALYLWRALRLVGRYRGVLAEVHSTGGPMDLSWLLEWFALAFLILLADASHFWIDYGRIDPWRPFAELVLFGLLLVMVLRFVVLGLRHPRLFVGIGEEDLTVAREAADACRKRQPADGELQRRGCALEAFLDAERPELDPGLTLAALARRYGQSPRRVSRTVNAAFGMSFSEWINRRRVEEARRLLSAQPERTVLDILQAAGFASKSTFNDAFKRYAGETPTQFRKRQSAARRTAET
ncbi:MAG: helix-turn-helix domain-containing protein [Acidobacteriota bacterium]